MHDIDKLNGTFIILQKSTTILWSMYVK